MSGMDFYTIGGLENDPPEQRAWLRHAAAVAHAFHAQAASDLSFGVKVQTCMMAAEYLWDTQRADASFKGFSAEEFGMWLAHNSFMSLSALDPILVGSVGLQLWLIEHPEALDTLPSPVLEESDFHLAIPLGRNVWAPKRPSLREEIRAAAKRVRESQRKKRKVRLAPAVVS